MPVTIFSTNLLMFRCILTFHHTIIQEKWHQLGKVAVLGYRADVFW